MSRSRILYVRCGRDDDYLHSLAAIDADIQAVVPEGDVTAALSGVDGVLLAGGPDVDPARYGELLNPTCELAAGARDTFELEVARRCLADGTPLLAICRGMQVLNVAAGGSLIQDLPSQVPVAIPHSMPDTLTTMAHGLEVVDGTHLARAVADGMPSQVNSRHHQAVKAIGRGLAATAHATDGIVEGIEAPDLPFCVGVQWHPENFWETGEFLPLFRLFAAACRERSTAHV
ncbi:MAG TPA: gamma-glutamyl-gamma-aminobutyrate hydrolase family protein [Luteitalea sp.]|nr:gamma-glutamyl-gamma-aminobutyrate hydrolase family protein [Luteitalea sp.]